MDFLERIFHVAPDGGNGLLELAIVMALLLVPLALLWVRRSKRAVRRHSGIRMLYGDDRKFIILPRTDQKSSRRRTY